jgi:hypothetical protein
VACVNVERCLVTNKYVFFHLQSWHTQKNSMSASNFALRREKSYRNFQNVKSSFQEQAMGEAQFFEWVSKFKSGVTSDEDEECKRCPSTGMTDEYVDQVRELLLQNRMAIHDVTNMLGISYK